MCRVAAPGRLGFAYVISLGGPPGSVHLLHVAGVSLPGSVVREIWWPRSKVMTVRNVRKGHCLEWNLNSKPDTPRSGHRSLCERRVARWVLWLRAGCHFHCKSSGALCEFIVRTGMGLELVWLTLSSHGLKKGENF